MTSSESRLLSQLIDTMAMANNFVARLRRVPSGRLAPQRWYDRGSYSLDDSSYRPIADRIDHNHLKGPGKKRAALSAAVLQSIGICEDIRLDPLSPYHSSLQVADLVTGIESNLIDVGFGVSQVLPVIQSLTLKDSSLLYLEQPEVHLHPRAQGELGELIARRSLDKQVIVETHSEHLINRARLLIAQGVLDPALAVAIYVDRTIVGSTITPIGFDRRGNFTTPWPNGFFDERYEQSLLLARAQSEIDDE